MEPAEEPLRKIRWGRWIAGILGAALFVIGVGPLSYDYIRLQRFIALAERNFQQAHWDEAAFYAGRAWQLDPRHDKALEILAKISRQLQKKDALRWMGFWAENKPRDPERQLDFARLILASGQIEAAEKILSHAAALPTVDPVRLVELQAAIALSRRQPDQAEALYRHLIASHPESLRPTYNLANILLLSSQAARRAEGKTMLLTLWNKNQMPLEVSRSLVQLARLEKQLSSTKPWLETLQTDPQASLADQLLAGEVLLNLQEKLSPEWFQRLLTLCRQSEEIYLALTWLRQHQQAEAALTWINTLPPLIRQTPLAHIGRLEILADLNQWEKIHQELSKENWDRGNHYRLAFLQEAYLRSNGDKRQSVVRKVMWDQMITSLSKSPLDVFRVWALAQNWHWPIAEKDQLFAALTPLLTPSKPWLLFLIEQATHHRDTLALFYFGRRYLDLDPTLVTARNNVAYYQLLLLREQEQACREAEQLFREHPDHPTIRTTWAFALYRQNRLAEALALMQQLPTEALERPATALTHGLILHALGQKMEAEAAFRRARQSSDLLPEEKALLPASP